MKTIIYLIFLMGNHSIPLEQHEQFVKDIKQEVRLHNVTFKIIEGGNDEYQEVKNFEGNAILGSYGRNAKLLRRYGHLRNVIIVGSPKLLDGSYWTLGFTRIGAFCDSSGGFNAFCTATLENGKGVFRYNESVVACAHEIFHGLGAKHKNNSINLMNVGILGYVHDSFRARVLKNTRRELCVK